MQCSTYFWAGHVCRLNPGYCGPGERRGRSHRHESGTLLERRDHQLALLRAYLDMLLQVLGALEGLSTEATLVRLEWDVDSNVGGNVVALDRASVAPLPATDEIQVVSALPSDMSLTEMLLMGTLALYRSSEQGQLTKRLSAESARSPHCFHLHSRVSSVAGAEGRVAMVLLMLGWASAGRGAAALSCWMWLFCADILTLF